MEAKAKRGDYISDLSIGDTYSKGWQLFRARWQLLLVVLVATTILSLPTNVQQDDSLLRSLFNSLYSLFILGPVGFSASWVYLRAARGEEVEWLDMFAVFQRNYTNAVLAGLLTSIAIGIGFILFIIPGIYIALRLAFVSFLVIDEQMGAMDALQASWQMTDGYAGRLFGLGLVAVGLLLAGLLALFVGVFIAGPIISATFAIFYHSVRVRDGVRKAKVV